MLCDCTLHTPSPTCLSSHTHFSQWSLQPLTYEVIKPQGAITFRTIIFPRLSHSQWCQTTPNWRISSGFTIFQLLPPLARDLKREQRGCWIAVNEQLFPHFKTWKRVRVAYCGASNNFSPFGSILLPGIILKSHCMPSVSLFFLNGSFLNQSKLHSDSFSFSPKGCFYINLFHSPWFWILICTFKVVQKASQMFISVWL